MRTTKALCLLLLMAALAFSQTGKEFEVASIRTAPDQLQQLQVNVGLRIDGAQVHISYLSLKDYISIAYSLGVDQVIGPDWLSEPRFDISAKLPEGSSQSDVNEMLRSLLEDRFQMKAHREMREFPVYALEVASGGLKVKESVPAEEMAGINSKPMNVAGGGSIAGVSIDYGNGSTFTLGTTTLETRRLTMEMFSALLTRFVDRPVKDLTNLKGGYDLKLDITTDDRNVMMLHSAMSAGIVLPPQALALLTLPSNNSLPESLKRVGLSFEGRKAPLEVVVVDVIQKTPKEN